MEFRDGGWNKGAAFGRAEIRPFQKHDFASRDVSSLDGLDCLLRVGI